MTRGHDREELSATAQEQVAARRLARVLEGRREEECDRESLAVARLLEAVGGATVRDDLARVRLRGRLVRAVAVRPWRRVRRVAVAASLGLIGIALAVVWRGGSGPSPDQLDERERVARAAVAALLERRTEGGGPVASAWNRAVSAHVAETVTSQRLEKLHGAALLQVIETEEVAPSSETRFTPSPGGVS